MSGVFPPSALFHLVLSRLLAEHVTGQFKLLILVVPCSMEGPWLPIALNILEDIHHKDPIIKNLVMDISELFIVQTRVLLSMSCSVWGHLTIYNESLSVSVGSNG